MNKISRWKRLVYIFLTILLFFVVCYMIYTGGQVGE